MAQSAATQNTTAVGFGVAAQRQEEEPRVAEFYINGKAQLIKITNIERRGQMTQMHAIVSFDIS